MRPDESKKAIVPILSPAVGYLYCYVLIACFGLRLKFKLNTQQTNPFSTVV